MANESPAALPVDLPLGEEVEVWRSTLLANDDKPPVVADHAARLTHAQIPRILSPSPGGSPTNTSSEATEGDARVSKAQTEVGIDRCIERCWEYQRVVITAEPLEEIRIISAWFGHPENENQRLDIAADVSVILAEHGYAIGASEAGVPRAQKVELVASVRKWSDPAPMCLKQMQVTYDRFWLTEEERVALRGLQRRAQERALDAPDLEELLERLGTALLSVTATATPVPFLVPATDPTDPGIYLPTDVARAAANATPAAPPPLGRMSPRWKRLGFQACNPRTDLRTGRLALEALVYLAERYPLAAAQMASEAQGDDVDYPFAVASINVTQLLARYLGLVGDLASSSSGFNCTAPRDVLRVFAQLMIGIDHQHADSGIPQVDLFGELHAAAMSRLHTTWRALKMRDPQLTVMDFQRALDATMSTVHAFCMNRTLESPLDFRGLSLFDFGENDPYPDSDGDSSSGTLLTGAEQLVTGAARLFASGADGLSGTAGLLASGASAAGSGLQSAMTDGASRLSETAGQVGALFRVWQSDREGESSQ